MQLRSVLQRIAPVVGVIGLFLVGATPARAIVVGVNIDVHQDIVGVAPNDFHIQGRIESGDPDGMWSKPPVLIEHIDDVFPQFTYTIQPDLSDPAGNWYLVTADWSFPPGMPGISWCTVLHLGLFFDVTCHNIIIDLVGWWTLDGQRVTSGFNFGTVPVVGFAVEDQPTDGRQFIRIRNDSGGGGGGMGEPIFLSVVDMDLIALSREELVDMLGRDPFRELRFHGMQEQLPWVQVMQFGTPVSEFNPIFTPPDSFFDVYFDGQNSDLMPQVPITVQPGGFLLSRQLVTFTGNDGSQEFRWYYEIHGAHEPPPPPPPPPPGVVAGFNVDIHQDIPLEPWPNDFHIEGRIESGTPGGNWSDPPTLVDQVNDRFPFWNVSITPDLSDPNQNWYLVTADWWGAEVPFCEILHLGLFFRVTCHNVVIDLVGWWTRDGLPLPNFPNQGRIPIAGFRVNDWINEQGPPSGQVIRIHNGGGVPADVVQMDLFPADRATLEAMLGTAPFRELRLGGRQEMLPWIPVLHRNGTPISEFNPMSFDIDSFFDVFFEVPQAGEPTVDGPFSIPPGGFLLARELLRFVNNAGDVEWRWVWEMHGAHEQLFDLGDAPDGTNSWGALMTAYPSGGPAGVLARYPTVFTAGSPPHGPLHRQPRTVAYLGPRVTLEQEADIGPDEDPVNNLLPPNDQPDLDNADDAVTVPLTLPHCVPTTFDYVVTVVTPGIDLYVNAWFDWTRNGDWNEALQCPTGAPATEWAVQDQVLNFAAPGVYTVTTPAFVPWHVPGGPADAPIWMRVTLSEQPWAFFGEGGSGPSLGYDFGETEDYYFVPEGTGPVLCPVPAANPWCGNLQTRDCVSTDPTTEVCLPRQVGFDGAGNPIIELCDCFSLVPDCGPVDLQPKLVGYTVSCPGACPPGEICELHFNGQPTGSSSIDSMLIPAGTLVTCACVVAPLTQACCLANGLCVDVLYDDCVAQGGDPNGPGTTCATLPGGCTPLKWAQPPTFNPSSPHPECFWGWDDPSMYIVGPIVADDWLCLDERPVTDIHWWGSYPGWQGVTPPPDAGPFFHLGVWTDVPAGIDQPWSHPGIMVWQWIVPRALLDERPVACDFHPAAMTEPDGCFRYDFRIPQAEWFFQGAATSQVYWLSIAAMGGACACNGDVNGDGTTNLMDLTVLVACIQGGSCSGCVNSCDVNCDSTIDSRDADTLSCLIAQNPPNVCCPNPAVPHRWGWKTREHHFNDDAVRIFAPPAPIVGMPFESGEPIGQPGAMRWDAAFVLTTEEAFKEACCYYMTGLCADLAPADCVETGGTPDGPGTHCMGDLNGNGLDDACETCVIAPAPKPELILDAQGVLVPSVKNRFLSFAIAEPGIKAVRVKLVSLPGAFSALNGQTFWVDTPRTSSELPSKTFTDPVGAEATFQSATLRTTPLYRDWSATGVVHVYDERIIPSRKRPGAPLEPAVYEIQAIMSTCDTFNEGDYSAPLSITNPRWGDLAELAAGQFLAPDGVVEVTADVLGVLAKFGGTAGAPIKARAEMVGSGPTGPQAALTGKIEIGDVLAVLGAFTGGEYPFPPPP